MRRINRFVWSSLLIILPVFPLHAFAQVEAAIRGTVVARADRSVLSGAAIQLEGSALLERIEIRAADDGPRLTFQFNIENLSNNVFVVAQESIFSPGQYYIPRMYSASMKIRF